MNKAVIISLAAVLIYYLAVDYPIEVSCDQVSQIPQWRQLCIRSIVAGVALIAAISIGMRGGGVASAAETAIISMCTLEAVFSMLQLYGVLPAFHGLFKVTGSFYNPGPLGGYIALAIPIIANRLLKTSTLDIGPIAKTILGYALWISLGLIIISLPSTMSRTAWIATAISVTYVLICHNRIQPLISRTGLSPRTMAIIGGVAIMAALTALWFLKRDSAIGRLLLWRISALAIADSPITGNASFAEAYGNAQERYFAEGNTTEAERLMAGSPDYAFNEYLQIGVEYGLPVLLLALALLIFCIVASFRGKTFGLSGALVSFMVFAVASYPLHLPAFVAVLVLLVFAILYHHVAEKYSRWWMLPLPIAMILVSALGIGEYSQRQQALTQWGKIQFLYHNKQYHAVADRYAGIYDAMQWNGRFLYEYGHSIYKSGRYDEAIPVLLKSAQLSADPMVHNIIGECHQALGNYQEAEGCYQRSAHRIPSRLYPHYLLYFLYCEDGCRNDSLRLQEYRQVMSLEIKKESPATRDLRRKVREREQELAQ